jgi:hypothetical protein
MGMPSRYKIDIPFTTDSEVLDLVRQFESCELPYERWTHRAHLAVAVVYLQRYPFSEAIERARTAITRYNQTRGDPAGYHETITVMFMRLVEREMRVAAAGEWAMFVNDLAQRFQLSRLLRYYSAELLRSAEARARFLPPDLQPLDF